MGSRFFTQVEQAAFCTNHLVPGIGFSDDPLLQGRNFSYFDTQISRLGVNFQEIPVNRPVCPVMNFNRDGALRHKINRGTVNYWPNRFSANPPAKPEDGAYIDYPEKVSGIKARATSPKFKEHISQAELFVNSMSEAERLHMINAISFELDHCDDPVVYNRMTGRLAEVDLKLAQAVAEMVGGEMPMEAGRTAHGKKAPGLSMLEYKPATLTIATRRIAIIIADGFDWLAFSAVQAAAKAAQATPIVIGTKRGPIASANGRGDVKPDHHLEGFRSTLVDAVFIPGGEQSVKTLTKNGRALHWVREAFGHLKAIAATGEAVDFVRTAIALPEVTLSSATEVGDSLGVVTLRHVAPESFGDAIQIAQGAKGFLERFFYAVSQHKNWDRELQGLSTQVAF